MSPQAMSRWRRPVVGLSGRPYVIITSYAACEHDILQIWYYWGDEDELLRFIIISYFALEPLYFFGISRVD